MSRNSSCDFVALQFSFFMFHNLLEMEIVYGWWLIDIPSSVRPFTHFLLEFYGWSSYAQGWTFNSRWLLLGSPFFFLLVDLLFTRVVTWSTKGSRVFSTDIVRISRFFGSLWEQGLAFIHVMRNSRNLPSCSDGSNNISHHCHSWRILIRALLLFNILTQIEL